MRNKMFSTKLRHNLLPSYLIAKLFLLSPYSINIVKSSNPPPIVSYVGSLYAMASLTIYCIFHLYSSANNMNTLQVIYTSFVSLAIDMYNRYMGLVLICITTIWSIMKQRKSIDFILLMEECDKDFEDKLFVSNQDNKTWMRATLARILILFGVSSFLESINCLMYIQDLVSFSNLCMFICYIPLFIISMAEIQIISYLNLIKNRLVKINLIIDKLKLTSSYARSETRKHFSDLSIINEFSNRGEVGAHKYNPICKISDEIKIRSTIVILQRIYNNLYDASKTILGIYEVPIVFLALVHFTTLTTMMYYCAANAMKFVKDFDLSGDENWQIFGSLGWILIYTQKIFSIAKICQAVKDESYKIGRFLHVIGLNLKLDESKRIIKMFSHQILHQRINFVPCGFYEIDLGFMTSLIGAVTTYVAILLQFEGQAQTTPIDKRSTFMKFNVTTNHHG